MMPLWSALLLEAAAVGVLFVSTSRRCAHPPASLARIAALIAFADVLYEARPSFVARYPYNVFVEALYVVAFVDIIVACVTACSVRGPRLTGARVVGGRASLAWACVLAGWPPMLLCEWYYLWLPLQARHELSMSALAVSALYAGLHALTGCWLAASLIRAAHIPALCMWCGLGILLAGDFESRYVALHHMHSSAGVGTAGWTLGFLLFVAGLCATPAADKARVQMVPWASIQVVIALTTTTICVSVAGFAFAWGYVRCERADALGHLVSLLWLAVTGFSMLGMAASRLVLRSALYFPKPSLAKRNAKAVVHAPFTASYLWEGERLARAHRALQRRLLLLTSQAREASGRRRRAQIVAALLHEWQGPMAALEALVHTQRKSPTTDAAVRLATEALSRARHVAARAQRQSEADGVSSAGPFPCSRQLVQSVANIRRAVHQTIQDVVVLHALPRSQISFFVGPQVSSALELTCHLSSVRACLMQLLSNAIEAHRSGQVVVRLRWAPRRLCCELLVQDTGPGLCALRLHRVGSAQLDSGRKARRGVGLWTVARRARQWGGSFDCYLAHPQGLVSLLRLPVVSFGSTD